MAYSIPVVHHDFEGGKNLVGYLDSDDKLFDTPTELSTLKTLEVLYSGTATIVQNDAKDIVEIIITNKE